MQAIADRKGLVVWVVFPRGRDGGQRCGYFSALSGQRVSKFIGHCKNSMRFAETFGQGGRSCGRRKTSYVLLENKSRYTFGEVAGDSILFYGFVKHVEIIGEAVYMLTKEFKETHPEVDWEVIEGMRHVLVHGYYKIKPIQLWNTIEDDIPVLKPFIEKYYFELSGS